MNDAVLGIMHMQAQFDRILYASRVQPQPHSSSVLTVFATIRYVDVDVHHGDGVEEAFAYDRGVFSLSFHRHGPGFFPGTGAAPDIGVSDDDSDEDGKDCTIPHMCASCIVYFLFSLLRSQCALSQGPQRCILHAFV